MLWYAFINTGDDAQQNVYTTERVQLQSIKGKLQLDGGKNMKKEFSEGFMHDLADLLQTCSENKTDNVDLTFEIAGCLLGVNITFSVSPAEE